MADASDEERTNSFSALLRNTVKKQPYRLMDEFLDDIQYMEEPNQTEVMGHLMRHEQPNDEQAKLLEDSATLMSEYMTDDDFKNMWNTIQKINEEFMRENMVRRTLAPINNLLIANNHEDDIERELYGLNQNNGFDDRYSAHADENSLFTPRSNSFQQRAFANDFGGTQGSSAIGRTSNFSLNESSAHQSGPSSQHAQRDRLGGSSNIDAFLYNSSPEIQRNGSAMPNHGSSSSKADCAALLAYFKETTRCVNNNYQRDSDRNDVHREHSPHSGSKDRHNDYSSRHSEHKRR